MLLAYIDEIGETGAFVSRDDRRYNTSPAFGYAGFVVPEEQAWNFGAHFVALKKQLFQSELESIEHPGRWERKGASLFRGDTPKKFPQYIRVFNALVADLRKAGGHLFYYADEKPIGSPKQTSLVTSDRKAQAMREALNRIARHADAEDQNVLVMLDQVNERERRERLPRMYEHILGRAGDHREMRRIVEPPMHVDSRLSACIQFADWAAAFVSRAVDFQLIEESEYAWIADRAHLKGVKGAFTHESKLHLHARSISDFNHSQLFNARRSSLSGAERTTDPSECRRYGIPANDAESSAPGEPVAGWGIRSWFAGRRRPVSVARSLTLVDECMEWLHGLEQVLHFYWPRLLPMQLEPVRSEWGRSAPVPTGRASVMMRE